MVTVRERILEAAAELLDRGGPDAMSTRAVSAEAGVQAPTIYRLFRDKQGLLDAAAELRFEEYLAAKTDREHLEDPVEDLRRGWDIHTAFGLAHPAVYAAVYGTPRTDPPSVVRRADELLLELLRPIAAAGRLRVDERTAANVVHAAGTGTTLLLISTPERERDPALSGLVREAVLSAITTDALPPAAGEPLTVAARTVRAALPDVDRLTAGEKTLLSEWLERLFSDEQLAETPSE